MTIEALGASAGPAFVLPEPPASRESAPTQGVDFGAVLDREVRELNNTVTSAGQSLTSLASGESGNLHRVMLDLEQARTAFQLTVQVRNKLLESYQELMRMQI